MFRPFTFYKHLHPFDTFFVPSILFFLFCLFFIWMTRSHKISFSFTIFFSSGYVWFDDVDNRFRISIALRWSTWYYRLYGGTSMYSISFQQSFHLHRTDKMLLFSPYEKDITVVLVFKMNKKLWIAMEKIFIFWVDWFD